MDEPDERQRLERLSVVVLKEMLKDVRCPTSGNKSSLISRLLSLKSQPPSTSSTSILPAQLSKTPPGLLPTQNAIDLSAHSPLKKQKVELSCPTSNGASSFNPSSLTLAADSEKPRHKSVVPAQSDSTPTYTAASLKSSQLAAASAVLSGSSTFITGPAGTGKVSDK